MKPNFKSDSIRFITFLEIFENANVIVLKQLKNFSHTLFLLILVKKTIFIEESTLFVCISNFLLSFFEEFYLFNICIIAAMESSKKFFCILISTYTQVHINIYPIMNNESVIFYVQKS